MDIELRINEEIKLAMKSQNAVRLRGLRAIKQAVLIAKTSGGSGEISDADEVKLLSKLVKQRKDSIEIFSKESRIDLIEKEQEELSVIEEFMPTMMSEEELEIALKQIIADNGITSASEIGKLMGVATKTLEGKTDNKSISIVAKRLLS